MSQLNATKFLSDFELKEFNRTLEMFRLSDTRNYLILKLALATGARASELIALEKKDIDPHERTVFIKALKGSRDRSIPIETRLFTELWGFINGMSPTEVIFKIGYHQLAKIYKSYRPNRYKPFHALRHTAGLNVYRKTKDLLITKTYLGHADVKSTMCYMEYEYSVNELRKAIL